MDMSSTRSAQNLSMDVIPRFTGEFYDFWSIKMKTLFISQDLWDVVESGTVAITPGKGVDAFPVISKEEKMKDARALFIIQQGVSNTIFPWIMGALSAKDAWEILEDEFKGSKNVRTLGKHFETLQIAQGTKVVCDLSAFAIEMQGPLQGHEEQLNQPGEKNHELNDSFARCKRCKRPNHFAKDCWHNPKKEANLSKKEIVKENSEPMPFSSQRIDNFKDQIWVVATACSNHMSSNKALFSSLDETYKSQVFLANGAARPVEGKGTVAVIIKTGEIKYITEVYWVPQSPHNLLSVGQLTRKGRYVTFNKEECQICDLVSGALLASAKRSQSKYVLEMNSLQSHSIFD